MLEKISNQFVTHPKKLFIIDGFGALLSAFLLGVVLVQLEELFGIPRKTLYFLAFLPCVFAVYDFFVYFNIQKNLAVYLKGIAGINILYCCISMALAFYHYEKLSYLAWIYIVLEIVIVLILAGIEWKVANTSNFHFNNPERIEHE